MDHTQHRRLVYVSSEMSRGGEGERTWLFGSEEKGKCVIILSMAPAISRSLSLLLVKRIDHRPFKPSEVAIHNSNPLNTLRFTFSRLQEPKEYQLSGLVTQER